MLPLDPVLGIEDSDTGKTIHTIKELKDSMSKEGAGYEGLTLSALQATFMCNMDGRHGAGLMMSEGLEILPCLPGFYLQLAVTAQGSYVLLW